MIRAITKVRPASSRIAEQGISTQRGIVMKNLKLNEQQLESMRKWLVVGLLSCGCFALCIPTGDELFNKLFFTISPFSFAYMLFFRKGLYNPRLVKKYKGRLVKKSM
ncbi:hypothetical protein HKW97_23735 (plasmid) [Pseudomonas luteola]